MPAFSAYGVYSFVYNALYLNWIDLGITCSYVLHGTLQHTSPDSVLDEFGPALFGTTGTQESAQS